MNVVVVVAIVVIVVVVAVTIITTVMEHVQHIFLMTQCVLDERKKVIGQRIFLKEMSLVLF